MHPALAFVILAMGVVGCVALGAGCALLAVHLASDRYFSRTSAPAPAPRREPMRCDLFPWD